MNSEKLTKLKNAEKSIIKIFTTHTDPSYSEPWNILRREKSSGTGFFIKFKTTQNFLITNAHCVSNAELIHIKKRGDSFLYKCKIDKIIYECDLAILSVDSEFYQKIKKPEIIKEFNNNIYGLEIGSLPSKLDTVYVLGYPMGGFNISMTKGTVNRIQIIPYFQIILGLAIQIDAPLNFGNSGGPVLNVNGELVGIAFAGEDDQTTQNMGYVIPTTIIKYFLNTNNFQGLCFLGFSHQILTQTTRDFLGMKNETGILINKIYKFGSSNNILEKMDVLLEINNKKIDNDGTMSLKDIITDNDIDKNSHKSDLLEEGEIAPFNNIISLKNINDIVNLKIIRNTKIMNLEVKLNYITFLAPIMGYQLTPSYYILENLVFIPLSLMFFKEKKKNREVVSHLIQYLNDQDVKYEKQQIIILSQVFNSDEYEEQNYILNSINKIKIINLEHLHQVVKKELKNSKYLIIDFIGISKVIIILSDEINKNQKKIIDENLDGIKQYVF